MADIVRAWFSLNLIAVVLWAMWVEYRQLRRNGSQR